MIFIPRSVKSKLQEAAGYPNAIMPIGLTCTGNPRIFVTLSSSNAPTKL